MKSGSQSKDPSVKYDYGTERGSIIVIIITNLERALTATIINLKFDNQAGQIQLASLSQEVRELFVLVNESQIRVFALKLL